MHSGFSRFLDFIFPRTCIRCGRHLLEREPVFTCERCRGGYALIRKPHCNQCGIPFYGQVQRSKRCPACQQNPPAFAESRSLFLYRATGARLIHVLKYERGTWLIPEISSILKSDSGWKAYFGGSCIIPIPLYPGKERSRGYNQADVITRAIHLTIPETTIWKGLQRVRDTPSQTFLSRSQREANMRNAFVCAEAPPQNARLVIVDDVLTTGATLNAAIGAIQKRRKGPVHAFSLAHG